MAAGVKYLEVTPNIYELISDVDVVLSTDGDKVSLEILGDKDDVILSIKCKVIYSHSI